MLAGTAVVGAPPADAEAQVEPATNRLAAVDLFRGFAIIEVVVHHVSSYAMRQVPPDSAALFWTSVANRTLHFAVPGFLFMTALVFTRASLERPFRAGRFYRGRIRKTLVPYVAWTVMYGLFVVATTPRTLETLGDPALWWRWLTTGKAYYHLYFLLVALQFYAVFPLLVPVFRRRPSLFRTLVALVLIQLAVYWLNRLWLRVPATASWVPWYALPIGLGMYFGACFDLFGRFWARWRWWVAGLALVGWAWYLPPALSALRGVPVDTFQYALAYWLFSTATSLLLFGLCWGLSSRQRSWLAPVALLGASSLQVYLVHPAVIAYLDNVRDFPNLTVFLGYLVLYVVTLGVPLAIALLVRGSPLSRLLFGR